MRLAIIALLPLTLLVACAGGGVAGRCGTREARLANASATPLEQAYATREGEVASGDNQLGQADLAPGATGALRFPGTGRYRLRVVWADGRAVELPDLDGCAVRRVTVTEDGMRAE